MNLVLLEVTISQWNDGQLPWRLDLKEFRGKVSFCMEWAYTRLIKGMVLEEKQRCVMNNIVEGWFLNFYYPAIGVCR